VKPKIGAQLIIWGDRTTEDLPKVLDDVSAIGYDGIEAGPTAFEKVTNPKELLTTRDLSLAGLHMGIGSIDDSSVRAALDILKKMDSHYLLFSGAGGKENTEENYRKNARLLAKVGKRAQQYRAKVCYHNHWQEIVNNAMGTRIICEETTPELVSLCVDTYWVRCGGLSPAEFIEEHLDRVAILHLKDGTEEGMRKYEFLELGQGIVDFPAVIEVVKSADIEWYVVEQDRTNKTPKESMAISREYLRTKLGL